MNDLYHQLQIHIAGLWRKKWYIVLVAWVLSLAGWVTVMALPDRYEAQARIYVDTDSLLSPLLRGISVEGNVAQQVDFMQRTLLSRPNLEKLIRMTDLDLQISNQTEKETFLKELAKRIAILDGARGGRNLFTVSFTDPQPEAAQRVVQSLLSIFVESNVGQSRTDIEKARQFLDVQIAEYEKQLRAAEARLAEFKRQNLDFIAGGGGGGGFAQRLEVLRTQRVEAKNQFDDAVSRRESLRRDLAKVPEMVDIEVPVQAPTVIIDNTGQRRTNALASLQLRVDETEKLVDSLKLRYTDQHPDMVAARRNLAGLKEQLETERAAVEKETGKPVGTQGPGMRKQAVRNMIYEQVRLKLIDAETLVEATQRRLQQMDQELTRLEAQATRAPQIEAEFATLNRDYGVLKKNYDELTARRESARIADAVETKGEKIQFRIVDPPQIPSLPSGPPRLIFMSAVLVGALGAGVIVAFLMAQLDDSFISLSRLKETVAIPVLGSISLVLSSRDRRRQTVSGVSFATCIALLVMTFGALALVALRVPLPFV